jgi:TRAP-type uncharacterized transport system fused permease subunit
MCRKHSRINISVFFEGLKKGALLALPISVACGTAGIVVGVVGQTGIGLQFTQFLMALSGGYLWSVLGLTAIASVILGMGLPVTAAYIVLSIIAVPSLTELGVGLLAAHMIVFWLSQTSNVTPPIALAAFAAAGIANTSPMRSAVQAFKLAQGFFIIPIMMAFSGLIWIKGHTVDFIIAVILTIGLIIAFAGTIEGRLATKLPLATRGLLLVAGFMTLMPYPYVNLVGIVIIILTTLVNYRLSKMEESKPANVS